MPTAIPDGWFYPDTTVLGVPPPSVTFMAVPADDYENDYRRAADELVDSHDLCNSCKGQLEPGFAYEHRSGVVTCRSCWDQSLREAAREEASAFAKASCKITGSLERYDPSGGFAPTPQEYESGSKEAYTANAVRAFNRHNSTNYDELIRDLDRDDPVSCAYYSAIRERIEELLDDADCDET